MAGEEKIKILAVDDDPDGLFALEAVLKEEGFEVITASNGNDAFAKLQNELPDVALVDVMMPGIDGYEVTRRAKSDPVLRYIPLVLLTARSSLDDIVSGLNEGADDYITKPFDKVELIARLNAILRLRSLYKELQQSVQYNENLRTQLEKPSTFANMVGKSPAIQEVYGLISKVASSKLPVLITGESGTGKELVARAVHFNSNRKDKPFVVQNCSTFNETLLESELFGHVKGAYTGAQASKRGLFEVADTGTFFLDEIGEMSPQLQAKLLRVLQEGTFIPVGDTKEKKVDVRIVAATNRDIKKLITDGKFREDLYYRICVIAIHLPPLRDRREDIIALAQHFLNKADTTHKKKLSAEISKAILDYNWPGNIRQLQNEIERLVVLSGEDSVIDLNLASNEITNIGGSSNSHSESLVGGLKEALLAVEKKLILDALKRTDGNKSEAARELGISRSNLIAKAQEYGFE
ncbi:MAG: sigma-54 dependent transcriptional regulator [bacterium]|nr:sigma-54 dependent transcriptional regulator [bacterium]